MKYTTLAKVKAQNTDTTMTDPQIEELIEFVSGYMDSYIGYSLAKNYSDPATSLFLDGSGTEYLILPNAVNGSLTLESVDISGSLANVDYIALYPLNKPYTEYLGLKLGKFQAGMANYKLSGVRLGRYKIDWANSANHNLPTDLTQAATSLASEIVRQGSIQASLTSSGIITSEDTGSYSVSYATPTAEMLTSMLSLVPTATSILKSYKKINIV